MFDHLPLMHIDWSVPGTPKNSERRLNSANFQLLRDNIATDSQFLLDGSQSSIQCFPISDYARRNLFYMQGFTILYAKEHYYTLRKDFDSCLLLYTLDGNGTLEYGDQTFHLVPNTGFLIDCRQPHFYHTDGSHWTHADLHFDGERVRHLLESYNRYGGALFEDFGGNQIAALLEQLLEDYTHCVAPYREELTSNQIESIILTLIRHKEQANADDAVPDTIRYLVRYMENHYARPLTLDFLSSFAGLSKYHLSREFKRFTGFSPIEYLINLRVAAAQQLLISTEKSVAEIASETGFNNLNNFAGQFRKRAQMTPSEYRKERKKHLLNP